MRVLARPVALLARVCVLALSRLPARDALRELFALEDHVSLRLDQTAIRLDGGIHPKHRLMRYHDFFVDRITEGERVLDVGCGYGAVAAAIAERARARVVGVDFDAANIEQARRRYLPNERLVFVESDIHDYVPEERFEVVVLSNVLEHIADRGRLLRLLVERAQPSRLLIRVPMFDRDWRVPLREEVGLDPYQDATHEIEYRTGELEAELAAAGLAVGESVRRWGELWVVARPVG